MTLVAPCKDTSPPAGKPALSLPADAIPWFHCTVGDNPFFNGTIGTAPHNLSPCGLWADGASGFTWYPQPFTHWRLEQAACGSAACSRRLSWDLLVFAVSLSLAHTSLVALDTLQSSMGISFRHKTFTQMLAENHYTLKVITVTSISLYSSVKYIEFSGGI